MSTLRDLLDRVRNARVEAEACYCHDDLVCQLCGKVMGAEGDLCTWLLDHPEAVEAVEALTAATARAERAEALLRECLAMSGDGREVLAMQRRIEALIGGEG